MSQSMFKQHMFGLRLPPPVWELYHRLSVNFMVKRNLTNELKQAIMIRLVEVAKHRRNYLMREDDLLLPIPKDLVDRVQNYAESLEDAAIAHHRK